MLWLRQSTAVEISLGPFVDQYDGFTAETALTITQVEVRLKKNGDDWTQKNESTSLVHEENGYYRCLLDSTDTNTLGMLRVAVSESGALPIWQDCVVMPANVYDSLLSTDKLQVDVTEMAANTITASALAADAGTEIADAILKRDMSAITGEAARSPLNAIRKLMNKWSISGSTLTITKEDDTTTAYTQAITTDASANPITALDTS